MSGLVSIIIPVYNMEDSLESSVRSILGQDYSDIEIILVDDGSEDSSCNICRKLAEADSRVRYIHTENRGSGPARNAGIAESQGRYLYFPDADDYLSPNAISTLVAAMCGGKYDLVVFGYRCLARDGRELFVKEYEAFEEKGSAVRQSYSDYFSMASRYGIQGAPWNKFFDGDTVRKNKIEYPPIRRHQDEGFIARYVSKCESIRFIPEVLYSYYQNTVGSEWKKYPRNYMASVLGLRDVWQETILSWNPGDSVTHEKVEKEIFSKIIKAMELSYSPKMELSFSGRIKWLAQACGATDFREYKFETAGSSYQGLVLLCAKLKAYLLLSLVLYIGNLKNIVRQGK